MSNKILLGIRNIEIQQKREVPSITLTKERFFSFFTDVYMHASEIIKKHKQQRVTTVAGAWDTKKSMLITKQYVLANTAS